MAFVASMFSSLMAGSAATGTVAATGATVTGAAATTAASAGTLAAGSFVPATAGLFGSGGAFTAASIFNGTMGLFGAMSMIGGASQSAAMMRDQARWAGLQARQEELRGLQESNRMRQSLLETMATQNARWGFAGIDIGAGTPVAAQEAAIREADYQLDTSRDMAATRAASRRATASRLRMGARSTRLGGYGQAATSLMSLTGGGG